MDNPEDLTGNSQSRVDRLKKIGTERLSATTPFENYFSHISAAKQHNVELTLDDKSKVFKSYVESWNKLHPNALFNIDDKTAELFLGNAPLTPFHQYFEFMRIEQMNPRSKLNPAGAKVQWDHYVLDWNKAHPDQKISEDIVDWLVPFHRRYYLLEE